MEMNTKHEILLKRLLDKGVVILQAERMAIGIGLKGFGLVNGRPATLMGEPCYVVYGFTDAGFDFVLSHYPSLVEAPETFDTPPQPINSGGGDNDNGACNT
jgi:hypothetical protein